MTWVAGAGHGVINEQAGNAVGGVLGEIDVAQEALQGFVGGTS